MDVTYAPMRSFPLGAGAGFAQPSRSTPVHVTLDSSALELMTDLTRVSVIVIHPEETIMAAQQVMNQHGVHLLLVINANRNVVGVITSTDLCGEKPMQVVAAKGTRRDEILVREIMTQRERIEVLSMNDVRAAKVGHIVATMLDTGRQHAMVVSCDQQGRKTVRGLFSANQIACHLGTKIYSREFARTFAEIEMALVHS